MGTTLRIILALAAVATVVWFFWPRPEFVITIRRSVPRMKRGRVVTGFLEDCGHLCREWQIETGSIRGVRATQGRVSLRFSRSIAREHHQRFRNCWGMRG